MGMWQPEIANSLQFILDFKGTDAELEPIAGNFVVTETHFGEVIEVELVDGGSKTPVTLANRKEFVRLRIAYEF